MFSFTNKKKTKAKYNFSQKMKPPYYVGKVVGKEVVSNIVGRNAKGHPLMEANEAVPNRTTYMFAFEYSNPTPRKSPSHCASNNSKIYRHENYTVALSVAIKYQKPSTCPHT